MRRRQLFTAAGALLLAGGLAGGFHTELTTLELGLGRRVAFLSDLHIHAQRRLELPPYDILLIGGDTYDELTPDLAAVAETLRRLPGPKIAVLGNHERWASRWIPLRRGVAALEEAGVHVLADDWVQIGGLRIYGLDWRDDPRDYPPVKDADVVLVHSPDAFHTAAGGLYLAGHTHGGHICLPGNVPLYTNSRFGYTWGLYRRGGALMYVTRGAGEMTPRAFCSREAVMVL
ncbi:metallophosphoesterase [Pyrobaculum neutrophilum]|uniref:Metallophosphoesterase n=1 Tax=Pyrobaculum neutrophilum (strain DSM 2338 / JCM 9278 / NBRC 100436 / V24Sta) TaxID=444157 RepID=B1Y8L6_PYRNV|nr:metallophosphoesterase [Pyrobaculum neutrophilum]ACB40095.1 metallophosphoesterase [Pyrobaculum neutrophilum V24Sta]